MSLWTRNNFGDVSYQLWDEDDETQINNPNVPGEPVEEGRAVYLHGGPGETYTIRGFDTSEGCVKDFSQRITLTNLATERIITAEREKICEGDVIKLGCITLGETTYEWTGPNGFTSTDQNFVIPNATTDMTGTYTVTVCPEFCGDNVEEHIYIKVRECFIPVNPNVHVMK